jgi:hypothetical protein
VGEGLKRAFAAARATRKNDAGEERHAAFGWGAPPFQEQFPTLSAEDAHHFDADNEALMRLRVRGYLTDRERDNAIEKITKRLSICLATPPESAPR